LVSFKLLSIFEPYLPLTTHHFSTSAPVPESFVILSESSVPVPEFAVFLSESLAPFSKSISSVSVFPIFDFGF